MKDRDASVYRQVGATNSGLHLLDRPGLLRAREAYQRLLRQIGADPAAGLTAEATVLGYLAEIEAALAERAGGTVAA